jgi:hypothetical protein
MRESSIQILNSDLQNLSSQMNLNFQGPFDENLNLESWPSLSSTINHTEQQQAKKDKTICIS